MISKWFDLDGSVIMSRLNEKTPIARFDGIPLEPQHSEGGGSEAAAVKAMGLKPFGGQTTLSQESPRTTRKHKYV